jgi:hypothetical protein
MEKIIKGTQIKINVHMEAFEGVHFADVPFTCTVITRGKRVKMDKSELIQVDADNYVALLDTAKLGLEDITLMIEAEFDDSDFGSGIRKEVCMVETGLFIVPWK